MNINKDNYLAFFLDYHEGTLSPAQKLEVEGFLVSNPEFKEEFEAFDASFSATPNNIIFQDKNALKRTPEGVSAYNQEIIAYIEADLNHASRKAFLKKLDSDSVLKEDLRLFQLSKLLVETIVFADKEALKKRSIIRRLVPYVSIAAAACLTLIIGYYYIQSPVQEATQTIASVENTNKPVHEKSTAISPVNIEPKKAIVYTSTVKSITHKKEIVNKCTIHGVSFPAIAGSEPVLASVTTPQLTVNTLAKADEQAEKQAATSTSFTAFAEHYIQKRINDKDFDVAVQKKERRGFFAYAINKLASITGGNFGVRANQDTLKQTKQITLFAGNFEVSRTSRK